MNERTQFLFLVQSGIPIASGRIQKFVCAKGDSPMNKRWNVNLESVLLSFCTPKNGWPTAVRGCGNGKLCVVSRKPSSA
jgi:hypothetical protein